MKIESNEICIFQCFSFDCVNVIDTICPGCEVMAILLLFFQY